MKETIKTPISDEDYRQRMVEYRERSQKYKEFMAASWATSKKAWDNGTEGIKKAESTRTNNIKEKGKT